MRHVRIDDSKPRQGKTRTGSHYTDYLARICDCNHPGAHPPCSGCTSAVEEEQFYREFEEEMKETRSTYQAIGWIIEKHHEY